MSLVLVVGLMIGGLADRIIAESSVKANVYHYVALGDSLTFGFEPGMDFSIPAYGFVERVYEQALFNGRAQVTNLGIPGLTSEGLKIFSNALIEGKVLAGKDLKFNSSESADRFDPFLKNVEQMKAAVESANLITITIGGNDFLPLFSQKPTSLTSEFNAELEARLKTYSENVATTLGVIYKMNPNVTVVIADQYNPYPKIAIPDLYDPLISFTNQWSGILDEMAINLTKSFDLKEDQLRVAHISKPFLGKELAWTHIIKNDIHANQTGYVEMARVFAETIWGSYKQTVHKDPIAIVVNGKELETQYKPVLKNNTTYVAVREYVEALGGEVTWNQQTQSAGAKINGVEVQYKLNSNIILVNGTEVTLDQSIIGIEYTTNGKVETKTYVPLRALAEKGLGLDVKYVQKSNTAYINP